MGPNTAGQKNLRNMNPETAVYRVILCLNNETNSNKPLLVLHQTFALLSLGYDEKFDETNSYIRQRFYTSGGQLPRDASTAFSILEHNFRSLL